MFWAAARLVSRRAPIGVAARCSRPAVTACANLPHFSSQNRTFATEAEIYGPVKALRKLPEITPREVEKSLKNILKYENFESAKPILDLYEEKLVDMDDTAAILFWKCFAHTKDMESSGRVLHNAGIESGLGWHKATYTAFIKLCLANDEYRLASNIFDLMLMSGDVGPSLEACHLMMDYAAPNGDVEAVYKCLGVLEDAQITFTAETYSYVVTVLEKSGQDPELLKETKEIMAAHNMEYVAPRSVSA